MEQRPEASSETASDSVEDSSASIVERYFWPILLGTVVLSVGASAAVVYTQYGQVDQTLRSMPYVEQTRQLATEAAGALPYVGAADTSSGSEGTPRKYGSFTRMDGLVVNPAGSDGRYLAVSIAFESKSASAKAELEKKTVVVRDAILSLLSAKTVEELSDPDQRDELKAKLLKETNSILGRGTINRLYFTEFVLQ
jgi:flagellar FliL protein